MKTFTTSAQKTLILPKDIILQKLEDEMTKDVQLVFEKTKVDNMKEAKLEDGSAIVIASFDKEDGKTLAMIDFTDLPGDMDRKKIQSELRNKLDKIF